jgi:hypothetical protein
VIIPLEPQGAEIVGEGLGGPLGPRSWTPDGKQIVVGTEDYNSGTRTWAAVVVAADGTIGSSHTLTPPSGACQTYINFVAPDTGNLVASKLCGSQGPTRQTTIVELDRATMAVTRELVAGPMGQDIGPITVDASGGFLLYESQGSPPPGEVISDTNPSPVPHVFLLIDGTSTPFPQADAYLSLSW